LYVSPPLTADTTCAFTEINRHPP